LTRFNAIAGFRTVCALESKGIFWFYFVLDSCEEGECLNQYIKEMRIKSWLKNIFVFIPLVFSLELLNAEKLVMTVIAFCAFCLVSSAVYVFNDICDAEKDESHPIKHTRPIASGLIPKKSAAGFAALLAAVGLTTGFAVGLLVMVLIATYILLNLVYSMWIKHRPIFDCFCIAAGFVLRIYIGGVAGGEYISDWLFLTVIAGSLFLAFGKRRGEMIRIADSAITRKVLASYDVQFLNGMVFVYAGLSVVFYALWAMYRGSNMIYTVPLIIFLISKYLLLIHNNDSHGDPTTVIFKDKSLLVAAGLYSLLAIALLYL